MSGSAAWGVQHQDEDQEHRLKTAGLREDRHRLEEQRLTLERVTESHDMAELLGQSNSPGAWS